MAIVADDSEWTDEVVEEVERFWQLDHVGVTIDGKAEFENSFDLKSDRIVDDGLITILRCQMYKI